jgi:predicted nucleic acid-binding protein
VIYLDTGVLVRGLMEDHPQHAVCVTLMNPEAVSSCHALAEVFNTLTAYFKISNDLASEMVDSLPEQMRFEVIFQEDYLGVIRNARSRGIQGGIIYDAIHAAIARRLKVEKIVTYNLTNFRHVAPEIDIVSPENAT